GPPCVCRQGISTDQKAFEFQSLPPVSLSGKTISGQPIPDHFWSARCAVFSPLPHNAGLAGILLGYGHLQHRVVLQNDHLESPDRFPKVLFLTFAVLPQSAN